MRTISVIFAVFGIVIGIFALFGAEVNFEICMGSILVIAIALLMWAVWGRERGH